MIAWKNLSFFPVSFGRGLGTQHESQTPLELSERVGVGELVQLGLCSFRIGDSPWEICLSTTKTAWDA